MQLPRYTEHGVVGPASRPGPRGRRTRSRALLAGALVALSSGGLAAVHQPSGTEALFVSRATPQDNTIQGGIWAPEPPAGCGDLAGYANVVYGTMGDDVLHGGNHPQIIMGLDGNDTIVGGNSGDCLVGGPGNDRLIGGNAKDILLGGPGNDYLDGGNAKDYLDGEDDADECDGGNGKDDLVNCDDPVAPLSLTAQSTPDQTGDVAQPAPADTTASPTASVPAEPAPVEPTPTATPDPTPISDPAPPPPDSTPEVTP